MGLRRPLPHALGLSLAAAAAQGQTFDFFTPSVRGWTSTATGVSADGRVVSGNDGARGLTWTRAGGQYIFGAEPGLPGYTGSFGISGDGTTVVGTGGNSNIGFIAYRWQGPGTYQALGVQAGYLNSYARDANFDGSVVVGRSQDRQGFVAQAFRWTQAGGLQGLGFLPGEERYSEAMAVSADGNTVVGYSSGWNVKAFIWTDELGMRELPGMSGDVSWRALGCSSDAAWIVGDSFGRGALWHEGVFESLGFFGNLGTRATCVTDDGRLVGGAIRNYRLGFDVAAVWNAVDGWNPLSDYLAANGVSVPADWILRDITGMSADGRTFSGTARLTDGTIVGYVASIPTPATLIPLGAALSLARRRRS